MDSQHDLRLILNGLPAMVGYWDRDLCNVIANDAYVEFFGKTPEQMAGIHIRELLGPELFEKNLPFMRRALAGEPQIFDRAIPTPSGEVRYTQASYIPDVIDRVVRGFFVLVTDISARVRAEQQRALAERRFRELFEAAPIGTFLLSADGLITDVNQAAVDLLGRQRADLIGLRPIAFTHPDDLDQSRELLGDLLARRIDSYRVEKRYVHKNGRTIWAQLDARLLDSADDGELHVLAQVQDITARREQQQELQRLAFHDPVTGLLNRRGIVEALERECQRLERYGDPVTLMIIDLDHFKAVNDTYGHETGDTVLAEVAVLLRARLRETDHIARHGGDEFAIMLLGASHTEADGVAESLRDTILSAQLGCPDQPVSASIGLTTLTEHDTAADALRRADLAMYHDKQRQSQRDHGSSGPSVTSLEPQYQLLRRSALERRAD